MNYLHIYYGKSHILDFLKRRTDVIHHERKTSIVVVTRNIDGRADYMIELITKYSEIDFAMYDSAVVIVTSSPDHPVNLDEKRIIDDCFGKIGFDRRRIIRFGVDASILNHHLKMQLILINGA